MTQYRVHLRRESTQVVEFGTADIEEGDPVLFAAKQLADPDDWHSDEDEVDRVEVSHDTGKTWRSLPISEVLRMEKETA